MYIIFVVVDYLEGCDAYSWKACVSYRFYVYKKRTALHESL